MGNKIFSFLIVFLLLFSFVSAQIGDVGNVGDIQDRAEGVRDSVEGNISKVKGFGEKDKYDFLAERWKELLLKNKYISGVNGFFEKIDLFFLIVFGMHWSLSMQMFFAFLIWIFTFFSIKKYMFFTDNKGMKWVYTFLGVVLLAQIKFFSYFGNLAFMLVFYKDTILWKGLFFVIVVVLIVLWWKVNNLIAKILKKKKEKKKQEELEEKVEKQEEFQKNMVETAKKVME